MSRKKTPVFEPAVEQETKPDTFKAIGMKQVGRHFVAYTLEIQGDKVVSKRESETDLHPIVLDMAKVFFVEEFMGQGGES